jgi:hypothetical protein
LKKTPDPFFHPGYFPATLDPFGRLDAAADQWKNGIPDQHAIGAARIQGNGDLVDVQAFVFKDLRTDSVDIPARNSGFKITLHFTQADGKKTLTVTKVGADVNAKLTIRDDLDTQNFDPQKPVWKTTRQVQIQTNAGATDPAAGIDGKTDPAVNESGTYTP